MKRIELTVSESHDALVTKKNRGTFVIIVDADGRAWIRGIDATEGEADQSAMCVAGVAPQFSHLELAVSAAGHDPELVRLVAARDRIATLESALMILAEERATASDMAAAGIIRIAELEDHVRELEAICDGFEKTGHT